MTDAATTPAPVPAPVPARKKRRWRRRFAWAGAIVLVLAVVVRASLPFILPPVLDRVARSCKLHLSYQELTFTVFGADAELWHMVVTPEEGGEPIIETEYCRADISVLALLTGRLVVRRLETDGMDVILDRDADGRLAILKRLPTSKAPAPPPVEPEAEETGGEPRHVELGSPVEIDALRLQDLHVRIRDRSVAPPFETRLDLDLRLSNLASRTRPFRFSLSLDFDQTPILDSLEVEGQGQAVGKDLDVTLEGRVRAIHPRVLESYLGQLGLRPAAERIDMRFAARAKASQSTVRPEDIQLEAALERIAAEADGQEFLALDRLLIQASAIGHAGATIEVVEVEGARAFARRQASGALWLAGIETAAPPAAGTAPPASPPPAPTAVPAPPTAPGPAPPPAPPRPPARRPFVVTIGELRAKTSRVAFQDLAVQPAADIVLALESLSVKDIACDPGRPDAKATIAIDLTAPGIVEKIQVRGATVPFAPTKTLELTVEGSNVTAAALGGHLAALGLEPDFTSGSFRGELAATAALGDDGRLGAELHLTGLSYRDREELLALEGVHVRGLEIGPGAQVKLAALEVIGPTLTLWRDAAGSAHALGVRTVVPGATAMPTAQSRPYQVAEARPLPSAAAAPEAAAPPASAPAASTASVHIAQLLWKGFRARFRDDAVTPPAAFEVADGGVELRDLALALGPGAAPAPASLRAWLEIPGVADSLGATGKLTASASAPAVSLEASGKGITLAALSSYLRPLGIEPALAAGSCGARLEASARLQPGSIGAELEITDVHFRDGDREHLGMKAFRVRGVKVEGAETRIEAVEIVEPHGAASRQADGKIAVAGLRIGPPPPAVAAPEPLPAPPAPPPTAVAPPAPAPPAAAPAVASTGPAPVLSLGSFAIQDARFAWRDDAVAPPVDTELSSSTRLTGLVVGRKAEAAKLEADVKVKDVLDALRVQGTVLLAPAEQAVTLDVGTEGLRAGPLAAYFPPGTGIVLKDGRFRTHVEVGAAQHPEGGLSARLAITGTELRDGPQGAPYLVARAVRAVVSRLDPAAGLVAIEEVSVGGVEIDVERRPGGSIALLGLVAGPPPADAAPPAPRQEAPQQEAPAKPAPVLRKPREKAPLVTLAKLDLALDRLTVKDLEHPGATPIEVSALALRAKKPIELLGPEPDARPPVELEVTGKIAPIVDSLRVAARLSPFAAAPSFQVEVDVTGIRGEGVTGALPGLAELIDGRELTDGRFHLGLETSLKVDRRGPMDTGLGRPFGLELVLKGIEFKEGEAGPVLAGLDELRIEAPRIDPAGGAHLKTVELTRPRGVIQRSQEGIHALGFIVKLPPAAPAAPAGADAPAPQAPAPSLPGARSPPEAPPPLATAAAAPPPEIRLDKLSVTGIEFDVRDTSCTPPALLPIRELEVDVRGITTLALVEPRQIRFNVFARGGKVPLKAQLKGGVLGGALGDAAALVTEGKVQEHGLEERDGLQGFSVTGKLSLKPRLLGWVKVGVAALELPALKGPASAAGVNIESGIFDSKIDVRFKEDGSLWTSTRLLLTDLDVSEPPDGPIFRYLHLPAPLNAVVFALRDENGTLMIPVDFTLAPDGISLDAVAETAVSTLGKMIAGAFANAVKRAALAPVSFLGIAGGEAPPVEPVILEFAPGERTPSAREIAKLQSLLEQVRDDDRLVIRFAHELGGGDIARATVRANPAPDDCLALTRQLRSRRAGMLADRAAAAADARAYFAAGNAPKAQGAAVRARELERELGEAEDALDTLYNMLRPGADKQASRRTRDASLALARERLAAVRGTLLLALPGLEARIDPPSRPKFVEAPGASGGRVTVVAEIRRAR